METVAARPAKTLAEASRERRDIVSGEVMAEARLIRFVADPDGQAVPDLARKLPGRGIWVAADRTSVETAAKRGLFARSAKANSLEAEAALRHLQARGFEPEDFVRLERDANRAGLSAPFLTETGERARDLWRQAFDLLMQLESLERAVEGAKMGAHQIRRLV
eukprot:gene39758-53756_t